MTLDDDVALVLGLDAETRAGVDELLGALTAEQRVAAEQIRDEITSRVGTFPTGPLLVDASDAVWVAGYIGAGPAVAEWMRLQGVPDEVVTATLSDVGRQLRLHHRHTGRTGLDAPSWPSAVLAGTFYQLGRLQFDLGFRQDEWVLDVHIPESGPLTPDAVGASFERAVTFFGQYFPDQPVTAAVCGSWLLDPYLAEHLPSTSNIVAFQRLFTPVGQPRDDELDALYFTFGQRSLDNLDRLPRDSSLQRLVLDRLAAGEHWSVVTGYRTLSPRSPTEPSR